jgi:hypothetical protein
MRLLLTDILFPNKFAKWRLVEIHSLLEKYDTDILIINKVNSYANVSYNFDYDELANDFNLKDYNILIFNPIYNYIDKYNVNFDGKTFNNKIYSSYLFRKKKFGNIDFNINDYDAVYHIFLMNYNLFNKIFIYPHSKQIIHLYPGGGLLSIKDIDNIDPNVKLVPTQHFISNHIINNKKIDLFGGPFFYKNENLKKKIYNSNLTICFTSLGDIIEKGADKYIDIVNLYHEKYNDNNIKFISIGNCPINQYIKKYDAMDQKKLSEFYFSNVDILLNLDSGKVLNGFPLGIESIIEGCLLLTTDIHNSNIKNNFNFDNFIIVDKDNLESIVLKIKYLNDNREILQNLAYNLQNKIYDLFNYTNHMEKIFNFIED